MPEYTGQIKYGKATFLRPDLLNKWLAKNDNLWFRAKFSIPGKDADPKTAEQLGYYWACLLPEITRQLIAEGHTMTVRARGLSREIPINETAAHELLTELCGHIGPAAQHRRLSEMGKHETIKFIDYVVEFAVANLGMNEQALKARRPSTDGG